MDAVVKAMRRVSPGLEGTVYRRTSGNQVIGYDGRTDSWLLQTPDCWGLSDCPSEPPSFGRYLSSLRGDLAAARTQVDITTLMPYPSGGFRQAIVAGLKAALQAGHNPTVRVMAGCYPACTTQGQGPSAYVKGLEKDIGTPNGLKPKIHMASYRFYTESTIDDQFSWNHSKIVAVDGRTAIIGGHNMFATDYLQTTNPVHDVTMRAVGPIAGAGHAFANAIWRQACIVNGWLTGFRYLSYARSSGAPSGCPGNLSPPAPPGAGATDILGLGRIGLLYQMPDGIGSAEEHTLDGAGSRSGPQPADVAARSGPEDPAECSLLPTTDYTNDSPDYTAHNPGETGLRELIASASFDIFLSQQDLIGPCPGAPKFDRRLLDVIVDRLRAGVRVRIVTSTPKAKLAFLLPYSNANSLTDTTSAIYNRAWAKLGGKPGDADKARQLLKDNLRVGSLRFSSGIRNWPNGGSYNLIANHAKVIEVDRRAFYVGSQNLYPAWLAEYGMVVDDPTVADQFNDVYADPLWKASCVTTISSPDRDAPVVGDCSIPQKPKQCAGEPATITGTPRADQIQGTPGADVVVARDGNDVVKGSGGNDVLCGGGGDDKLRGADGRDTVLGQAGNDVLKGGDGGDVLKGGKGADVLKGGKGADVLKGGDGGDVLKGGKGADTTKGG